MSKKTDQLVSIVEAKYMAEQVSLSELLRREKDVRQKISRIDQDRKNAHKESIAGNRDMQRIGGDILWLSFLSNRKKYANDELFQIMAQKMDCVSKVNRAHSRYLSVKSLVENENQETLKRKRNAQASTSSEVCVLKRLIG